MSEQEIQDLTFLIDDLISQSVVLRNTPYSFIEGEVEIDPDSIKDASDNIVSMLFKLGYLK